MQSWAKAIAWTAVVIHLLAIALTLVYIAPVTGWPIPSMTGWQITWVVWIAAALAYAAVLAAWERGIGPFTAVALVGCACDAFHVVNALVISDAAGFARWQGTFRFMSLGMANALYILALLGLNLKSRRNPAYPRWLFVFGILVFLGASPMSIAGFFDLPHWDRFSAALAFAVLLPWFPAITYGWISQPDRNQSGDGRDPRARP